MRPAPAADAGGGAERASTYGVGELLRPPSTAARPRWWSGSAGRAPTTAERACSPRSAPPPTAPRRRRRCASTPCTPSTSRPARERLAGVELVVASDVDNPLTGLFGATKTYGPQKGLTEDAACRRRRLPGAVAAAVDRRTALEPGAGAAGGLGFALLVLGRAPRARASTWSPTPSGSPSGPREADLVITGEGAFDFSSRSGKVPYGVAAIAARGAAPVRRARRPGAGRARARCGRSASSRRTPWSTWSGEERAFADPAGALADLAERVARTWSRCRTLGTLGNNPRCATIEAVREASSRPRHWEHHT